MFDRTNPKPDQALDWLLVANAAHARLFERDEDNGALREIAGYVHSASRQKASQLSSDRPGRVHQGLGTTAFAPHTAPHERERTRFAHELAELLEAAALGHRMPRLVLMASNPFLGELLAQLGDATRRALRTSVAVDLTTYHGTDLEHRVTHALQPQA